jgi:hypothetical protein
MPFIRKAIVIDPLRSAESQSAVGAAHKHHIGCGSTGGPHTGQHVDVVVRGTAGAVNRKEYLPAEPYSIDAALHDGATETDSCAPVEYRCLSADLCVARANATKSRAAAPTANENVAVGIHIERSIYGSIWNNNRRLPRHPAVGGALELNAAAVAVNAIVSLVLESVPRSVGFVDGEPLFVAAACASVWRLLHPGLTAIGRAPQVVAEKRLLHIRLKTEIEKLPKLIGVRDRVAAEDVIL